jgi:hypothetical protein
MHGRIAVAILAATAVVTPAHAAQPVSPEPDARFYQYETVEFTAERSPADADADLVILFTADDNLAAGWLDLGPHGREEGDVVDSVDVGWLATKFARLGRFYWTVCPVAYGPADELDYQPVLDRCAASSPFTVTFRHPTLTRAQAKRYAGDALGERMRGAWAGGYGHKVSCRRATRIKQRCRVSWVAGDVVFYGRVTIYRERQQQWSAVMYRFSIAQYSEYCHLVNRLPLRSCQEHVRRHGQIG